MRCPVNNNRCSCSPRPMHGCLYTANRKKALRERLLIAKSQTTANHREAVEYAFEAARLFEERLKDG